MAEIDDVLKVGKLLTCVFENDAPLPDVDRLDLMDGIYIAPLPAFLLSADDEYHVMAVIPHFCQFFRDHLHRSTLNVAYQGKKDLNYEGVMSDEAAAKKRIDHYLLAAMLFTPHFVAPYASFVTIPEEERVCHSFRIMEFGSLGLLSQQPLTEADFERVSRLYGTIRDVLFNGTIGRVPTAFRYYHQAFRSDIEWSVRFLGMMMAMEALFSHGASEVSHQVSERAAFFLKRSPREREELYSEMRSHYSLRSKIAHGGTPSDAREKLEASFVQLLSTLRDALVRIVEDATTLSIFRSAGSEKFNRAMRSLVFHGAVVPES